MDLSEFLHQRYLGNELKDWLLAAAVVAVVLFAFPVIRGWLRRNQPILLPRDHTLAGLMSALLDATRPIVKLIAALYLGQKFLDLPPKVDGIFNFVITIGAWVQVAFWAGATLRFFMLRQRAVDVDRDGDLDPSPAINVVLFLGQIVIWSIVVLVALGNLGVNITGLVAGLGIGGIAVALAVQTILGDLLSSLSIAFDKPFMVDDQLRIDSIEGTVEYVGVRSTRLRSVTGEQIVISNGDLLKSRIHNLGRMPERRVVQRINLRHESTPAQIDEATRLVEEAVRSQPDTRYVSFNLMQMGNCALEFDLTYFISMHGRTQHPPVVDAVNRGIFQRFAAAGICLAYPAERQILN
jgi:small-conductance mechanosensitive channel